MAVQNFGLQALTLITTAILARILSPPDFGLVAIVTVVVGLFNLINQVGWGAALVVRKEISAAAVSTAFWASLTFGAGSAALLFALAGPVAALFGSPDAAGLLEAMAVVLVVGPPAGVARSLLTRSLRYRALSVLALTQQVVYAAIAILLAAVAGIGVWAIIVGRIAAVIVALALALVVARPPLRLVFDWGEFRTDLSFNAGFLSNGVTSYVGKNIDYWAVGRFLGEGPLGFYYVAYVVPNIIRQRFTWTFQATLFPLLARMSDAPERLRRVWKESVGKALLLVAPAMVGLALVAGPAVEAAFGSQWSAAAPAMSLLAFAAILEVVVVVSGLVFTAVGKPHLTAVYGLARLVVVGLLAVPASRLAATQGVAAAVLIGTIVAAGIALALLRREVGIGLHEVFASVRTILLPVAAMAAAVLPVRALVGPVTPVVGLGLSVGIGVLAYLGVGVAVHRDAFQSLLKDALGVLGFERTRRG